jgi:small subunit ribosomal protein S14e
MADAEGKESKGSQGKESKAQGKEAKAAATKEAQAKEPEAKDATTTKKTKEDVYVGPTKRDKEICLGIAHIYSTKNDTIIHVTDISGAETLVKESGGRVVRADRDEATPYAAMLAAQKVAARLKSLGVDGLHIRLCGKGGYTRRLPHQSAQSALRALARAGVKIGRIEDVTPLPHDSTRRKGGRRGRRL